MASPKHRHDAPGPTEILTSEPGVSLFCGWGRLIFAHTFPDSESLAQTLLEEHPGKRDIAFYVEDPHLLLNCEPQHLFLDPSNTYRLELHRAGAAITSSKHFEVTPIRHKEDIDEINRIYETNGMVVLDADFVWKHRKSDGHKYFVARATDSDDILGVALGVDHTACYDDERKSCSLWALSVDPQAELPGIGKAIVRHMIRYYADLGRREMDISVMYNNTHAIALYEKLGFQRVPVFVVKRRNRINEKLFVGPTPPSDFNIYATIIIDEALRRGIAMEPLDVPRGIFRLSLGGRVITCRESLSELTSAIAVMRTSDKQQTRELLDLAGLRTPAQITAQDEETSLHFLDRHKSVVVKPLHGEQGAGVSVDIRTESSLHEAIEAARVHCDTVLIEECLEGLDLRVIVINQEVVAAAVRKPPCVMGTGEHTIRELIERLSRRRSAATGGESTIPIDQETRRCLRHAGHSLDDVLPEGVSIGVRKTANLHTGGTIHDVTAQLHSTLREASLKAAHALEIPIVGLDLIVRAPDQPEYAFIEANERPGLANHEPQPTAQKFIDFLFPQSVIVDRIREF